MTLNSPWLRGIAAVTGAIILGEALALVVGVRLLSRSENPWATWRNDLLLGLDVVSGATLVWAAFRGGGDARLGIFYGSLAILLLSHGYREWEYLAGIANRFCINPPLAEIGVHLDPSQTERIRGCLTTTNRICPVCPIAGRVSTSR